MRPIFILVILFIIHGCDEIFSPNPQLLTLDWDHIQLIQKGIKEKSPMYLAAYQRLCKEADEALNHSAYSVIHKKSLPPSGDMHDYMSQGPYWWPNPETHDGLPYINRDGVRNPEVNQSNFDKSGLRSMSDDVNTLTLAWFFSGNPDYAEKAGVFLRTWFLDPETAMNPNLQYAQSIPGITEGRGIGIIDTRNFIEIIDAVKLLETSPAWNKRDTEKLKNWFSEYLDWLVNSENGKDERNKENNHGTWYDAQTACYALFTGKTDLAREIINNAKEARINSQIDSQGKQELELVRTRAFRYSLFNIEALLLLGKMGEITGVDLWEYNSPEKANIKLAFDFVLEYVDNMDDWPYQQITQIEWDRLIPLVIEASRVYNDPDYKSCLDSLQGKITSTDRLILTKL